jgi:uncharacterized tellurite resistance protein B-like protein
MAKIARKDLIMTLVKALIAAAWSDGQISLDERNCLKELLFNLRELTARDWASLEIYMAAPLQEEERREILDALRSTIRSPADKRIASKALKQMVESSGQTSAEQDRVVTEIMHAIQDTSVDPVSHLSKALRAPLRQRSSDLQFASTRELELEEFMRNRIAFHFRRQLHNHPLPQISDEEIQIWSAAGGLLARVAHVDRDVKEEERAAMVNAMATHWELPDQVIAALVDIALDEISKGLDFYRLTRQFYQKTNHEERQRFVTSLFKIALADGEISHDETEEIRHIARGLKLTHRQMIKAKLDATDA